MSEACCAPRSCGRPSAAMPKASSSAGGVRRDAGQGHPRRGPAAGGGRARGRDRRRVPPQLLLGPLRRALQRLRDQARRVQIPRRPRPRGRLHGHLCDSQALAHAAACRRRVRLPQAGGQGDAQDHHAGALHHALLPLHGLCRPEGLRGCRAPSLPTLQPSIAKRSPTSPRPAAGISSSTRSPSPCCATPPSATRSRARARTPTGSSISTSRPSTTA